MDKTHLLKPCSTDLLDDPVLKTSASNYDFKYVSCEQFERVIRNVQRDRLKKKKDQIWQEICSTKRKPFNKILTGSKDNTPLTQLISDSQNTNDKCEFPIDENPKVRVMTEDEIKDIVESAVKEVMVPKISNLRHQTTPKNKTPKNKTPKKNLQIIKEVPVEIRYPTPKNAVVVTNTKSHMLEKQVTNRSSKINSRRSIKNEIPESLQNSEECSDDESLFPHWICSEREEDESEIEINKSQKSGKINHSSSDTISKLHSPHIEINASSDKLDILDNESDESNGMESSDNEIESDFEKVPVSNNVISTPSLIKLSQRAPKLSTLEREELRKFLNLQDVIATNEVEIDGFEQKYELSDITASVDKVNSKNVHPIVYIKQKTPPISDSDSENDIVLQRVLPSENSPRKKLENKFGDTPRSLTSPKFPDSVKNVTNKKQIKTLDNKQINIKEEVIAFYAKISSYQTKIIYHFDQIKTSLINIKPPDDSVDRKKKEKRCLEFASRFSRNYLYQICRVIDDMRIMPRDRNSLKLTNELKTKVCILFSLMQHAIESYHRQLESFAVDKNPKKLCTLIEVVIDATQMCLRRNIFNKEDVNIEKIIIKAKNLKSFIQGAAEHISDHYTSVEKIKKSSKQQGKLSMYNTPGTPTAETKKKSRYLNVIGKTKSKTKVQITRKISQSKFMGQKCDKHKKSSDKMRITSRERINRSNCSFSAKCSARVCTQMDNFENINTLSNLALQETSVENATDKEINKTVMETLQTIAKEQMQEILHPLMNFESQTSTALPPKKMSQAGLNDAEITSTKSENLKKKVDINTFNKQKLNKNNDNQLKITPNSEKTNSENCLINELKVTTMNNSKQLKSIENAQTKKTSRSKTPCQALITGESVDGKKLITDDVIIEPACSKKASNLPAENFNVIIKKSNEETSNKNETENNAATERSQTMKSKVQQLKCDKNIQFTLLTSLEDDESSQKSNKETSRSKRTSKKASKKKENLKEKHIQAAIEEREKFLQLIKNNPLYYNEHFDEPWKVLSRITEKIAAEAINSVECNLNFGEETFVKDFIKAELSS